MTNFTPTPEQEEIIAAARETPDNLLIEALAGAAKTSTLVLIAEALRRDMILSLAFNKKIAVEMEQRLPGNCTSMTLNSLGHRAWAQQIGQRLVLDTSKTFKLLKDEIDKLKGPDRDSAYDSLSETLQMINEGKSAGYIPSGRFKVNGLFGDDDFFNQLDPIPSPLQELLIHKVSTKSIIMAQSGVVDFSDQILMPALFPCTFQKFPVILVDEAQDLSPLNHITLQKLFHHRLIAVGDSCQAIYGFRGADEDSMNNLASMFQMRRLGLSISFRCPRAVVREAHWRAPHMQWPDWAEEGTVRTLGTWSADSIPKYAAIICRNNAPLYGLAIRLLKEGRYCKIVGNDVAKGLIKIMQKLGSPNMEREALFAAIATWEKKELLRTRNAAIVYDKAECMRVFAQEAETLGGAITYADHLMSQEGPTQLMTGHKSKGLEFDDVFLLDMKLVGKEGQERNLRYVMQTRAKRTLTYVESEHFQSAKEDF